MALPSSKWFPYSLQDRVAWYQNFATQAAATGTTLGLSAADVLQITADNTMMQFLGTSAVTVDNYAKAVTAFRSEITEGEVGEVTPTWPADISFDPPAIPPTGIFERLIEYRKRIMASANYTPEVGATYDIVGTTPVPKPPAEVKPEIQAFAAASNYHFSLVVTGRELATMWDAWILRKGGNWAKHGTFSGKSADVEVTPTTPGDAEQIQVRVQLRRNNEDYGQPSDPVYVTVNP